MSDGEAAGEEWKGEGDGGVLPRGDWEVEEGGGVGIMWLWGCEGEGEVRDRGMCDGSLAGIRWRGTV